MSASLSDIMNRFKTTVTGKTPELTAETMAAYHKAQSNAEIDENGYAKSAKHPLTHAPGGTRSFNGRPLFK